MDSTPPIDRSKKPLPSRPETKKDHWLSLLAAVVLVGAWKGWVAHDKAEKSKAGSAPAAMSARERELMAYQYFGVSPKVPLTAMERQEIAKRRKLLRDGHE